jgi:7-keto-8-aminopelargonate synthetase-like enzyme
MFGSNSYLGLTNHPKVKEAAKAAIEELEINLTINLHF